MRKINGKEVLNQKEQLALLAEAMKTGDVSKLTGYIKSVKGNAPTNKELGAYTGAKGDGVVFSIFTDKEGNEYVSQVKVLKDGTKTKGFAVSKADFKAYVSKLNSIADKM